MGVQGKAKLNTLTNTPIKAYLAQGYFSGIELLNKIRQIDDLQKSDISNTQEVTEMISNLKNEITDLRHKCDEIKTHIQNFTTDNRYSQILELRYINGLNWSEISKITGYVSDWAQRLQAKALNVFETYLNENGIKYQ